MNAVMRHCLTIGSVRADRSPFRRYDLAPPERRANGVTVFEAVLASPGVSDYPELGFTERVTPEALRDPEWLKQLAGLPIIDDPDLHWTGIDLGSLQVARIGTLLDARWDERQQVTIVRIAIDTERGLRLVRGGTIGLSVMYEPDVVPLNGDPQGATQAQVRRRMSDHVLLTDTPRDIAARIRADATGGTMTPEQIAALKAELLEAVGKRADGGSGESIAPMLEMLVAARADAASEKARADELQTKLDEAKSDAEDAEKTRADAAPKAKDWKDVLTRADAMGIEVKDDSTFDSIRQAIVGKHLAARADATGDALDDAYALTIAAFDAAAKAAPKGSAWRNGTVRGDANSSGGADVAQLLTRSN